MHFHAHIKDCISDFGPVSAFWAFPFERFNGILESFSKKRGQTWRAKFLSFQELMTMNTIPEFSDFASLFTQEDTGGSLQQTNCNPLSPVFLQEKYHIWAVLYKQWVLRSTWVMWKSDFCDSDIESLTQMYNIIFPELSLSHIPRNHLLFSDLQVLGEHFISIRSRLQSSPAIMVYWGNPSSTTHIHPIKVGLVEYFFFLLSCNI